MKNKVGGARKGAGRKKELSEDARTTSFKCTPFERALLKRYLNKLRKGITTDNADIIYIDMRMNTGNITNLFN